MDQLLNLEWSKMMNVVPRIYKTAAAALLVLIPAASSMTLAIDNPGQQTKSVRIEVQSSASSTSEDHGDGAGPKQRVLRSGKMVIVGPDGKRQEFDLSGNNGTAPVAPQGEPVKKLMIGVGLSDVPPELAAHIGLDDGFGALIQTVKEGGPAEKAGLKKYDVITHINDQAILGQRTLQTKVEKSKGEPLKLRVIHAGQPKEVELKAEEMEVDVTAVDPDLLNGMRLPEEIRKQLQLQGLDVDGFMMFGPGVQILPGLPLPPDPNASQQDLGNVSKELEQLRQELQNLKESLKEKQ